MAGELDDAGSEPAEFMADFAAGVQGYVRRAAVESDLGAIAMKVAAQMFASLPDAAMAAYESGLNRYVVLPTYVFLQSMDCLRAPITLRDRLSAERRAERRMYELTLALASLASDPLTSAQKEEAASRFNHALIAWVRDRAAPRIQAYAAEDEIEF